jgi:hypothetical protein
VPLGGKTWWNLAVFFVEWFGVVVCAFLLGVLEKSECCVRFFFGVCVVKRVVKMVRKQRVFRVERSATYLNYLLWLKFIRVPSL